MKFLFLKTQIIYLSMILIFASDLAADSFEDFLDRLAAAPSTQRERLVDSLMHASGSFPLVENDTRVHFIYRGNASRVTIPGDANGWDQNAFPMRRASSTDLWYRTQIFEADARLDYKFILNGQSWILDPLNPQQILGGYGPNSELRMPQYIPAPEIEYDPTILHGSLEDTTFFSNNLNNSRRISIYTPPGYANSGDKYPLILFHDGLEYLSLAKANNVIDFLIAHRQIQPIIAVFVPPVNRTAEYAGELKQKFTAFIIDELVPYIDNHYRTKQDSSCRAMLGASNGGNIALWIGLHHPEVFGNITAQSSNVETSISTTLETGPKLDLKFYLDLGTYDISVLIPLVRNLKNILDDRGYEMQYHEFHEGHSWGNWRAHIDNALEMFFPAKSTSAIEPKVVPQDFILYPNYPNPFNGTTNISFTLPREDKISLAVFNLMGQKVCTLADEKFTAGTHFLTWNGKNDLNLAQPSGIYICRIDVGKSWKKTFKMVLLR